MRAAGEGWGKDMLADKKNMKGQGKKGKRRRR